MLFNEYPKIRPQLPQEYVESYNDFIIENRTGSNISNRIARHLEGWMHRQVKKTYTSSEGKTLELGAGNLNHLEWEIGIDNYDIVEPNLDLLDHAEHDYKINEKFSTVADIPSERQYDRIISIAVLEHMTDLPMEIALSAMHMSKQGKFCAGIPSEGGWLWEMAWKYGTGPAFKRRTGLDYSIIMQHEHVNNIDEIEKCIDYFFDTVTIRRFPFPTKNTSFYTYIEASNVDRKKCTKYIESRTDIK